MLQPPPADKALAPFPDCSLSGCNLHALLRASCGGAAQAPGAEAGANDVTEGQTSRHQRECAQCRPFLQTGQGHPCPLQTEAGMRPRLSLNLGFEGRPADMHTQFYWQERGKGKKWQLLEAKPHTCSKCAHLPSSGQHPCSLHCAPLPLFLLSTSVVISSTTE